MKRKGLLILNKWCFKFGLVPIYLRTNCILLHFGIFKITSIPPEAMNFTKKNYKGFWLRKEFIFTGFEINL